jgi:hypothetical protein
VDRGQDGERGPEGGARTDQGEQRHAHEVQFLPEEVTFLQNAAAAPGEQVAGRHRPESRVRPTSGARRNGLAALARSLLLRGRTGHPARVASSPRRENASMLQTLVIVLVVLWLLGMVSSYTLGGFLHVLLVVALVLLVVRLATGRSVV